MDWRARRRVAWPVVVVRGGIVGRLAGGLAVQLRDTFRSHRCFVVHPAVVRGRCYLWQRILVWKMLQLVWPALRNIFLLSGSDLNGGSICMGLLKLPTLLVTSIRG